MATTTPRIGLTKPDGTDLVDIAVLNTNFDKIDSNIASTKIQSTKPTTANAGDLWWDSDTGTLYLYYTDANSSQWVAATSDPINIGVVASQAERDAQYPTPAQGMSVYRTDLGMVERYYGLFNVSTNPGGRDTAGWYTNDRNTGYVPIKPTTLVIASGTGTIDALGKIQFTAASKISLQGLFSSKYQHYKVVFTNLQMTTATAQEIKMRFVAGTTERSTSYYLNGTYTAGTTVANWYIPNGTESSFALIDSSAYNGGTIEILNPLATTRTQFNAISNGYSASANTVMMSGFNNIAESHDGVAFFPASALISGSVQVFGLNG